MRFISFLIEETDWENDKPVTKYDGRQVGDKNQRRKLRAEFKRRQIAMCHEFAIMLAKSGHLDPRVSIDNLTADLIVAGPRQGVYNTIHWALDPGDHITAPVHEFLKKFPKIKKLNDELVQIKFAYEAYGGKLVPDA